MEIVRSVYDLDNIRLNDINGPVHSEYELEYLLLEGHCFDSTSGAPPRGLQFTLGTKDEPIIVDTIVMANLGYFQLKANPGAWILKLRHGKSEEIYDITRLPFVCFIFLEVPTILTNLMFCFLLRGMQCRGTKHSSQNRWYARHNQFIPLACSEIACDEESRQSWC